MIIINNIYIYTYDMERARERDRDREREREIRVIQTPPKKAAAWRQPLWQYYSMI